jgi:glycosyltransferase involved in cell wall biosynthesis
MQDVRILITMDKAMTKPLVSSIIIFLNGDRFLVEAIESIFAQTYDNWELLLVDDGSTDNSMTIALDYVQKYPDRVRYLHHQDRQNLGMSASRNVGIEFARGDYIAFLDADDIWMPLKLAQQVAILETHPEVAMVYGQIQYWYSWTGNSEDKQRDYFMDLGVASNTLVMPPKLLPSLWTGKFQQPGMSNTMIRRTVFETIGRLEDSFRGFLEDNVFYTKLNLNYPVFVSSEYWVRYRKHEDSSTTNFQTAREICAAQQPFISWAENYLFAQGMKNTEIWKIFQKIHLPYRYPILYFFWRGYLEIPMSIGREILPISARHWLWLNIGSKLYENNIKKSESI